MSKIIKWNYIICFVILLICQTGCNKEKQVSRQIENNVIKWDIYDPYSIFSGNWNNYELLKTVTKGLNIDIKIKIISKESDSYFAKTIMTGEYPDLITFYIYDNKLQKALSSYPYFNIENNNPVFDKVPDEVKQYWFRDKMWFIPGGFFKNEELSHFETGIYINNNIYHEYNMEIDSLDKLKSFICYYCKKGNMLNDNIIKYGVLRNKVLNENAIKILSGNCKNNFMNSSDDITDLQSPIVFIGEYSAINKWNQLSHSSLYTRLNIKSANGNKYSVYGTFATIITDSINKKIASCLVSTLMKKNNSIMLMCGTKNVDYIVDSKTNNIIYTDLSSKKINNYDSSYLNRGISVFPYVSSFYPIYPNSVFN